MTKEEIIVKYGEEMWKKRNVKANHIMLYGEESWQERLAKARKRYKPELYTKEALIERKGQEWYDQHLLEVRTLVKKRYYEDIEKARQRYRDQYDNEHHKAYCSTPERRLIYGINVRDRNRLKKAGYDLTGLEVHHNKYHKDSSDPDWIQDILILTPAEHDKWHAEHPDFHALDNVV